MMALLNNKLLALSPSFSFSLDIKAFVNYIMELCDISSNSCTFTSASLQTKRKQYVGEADLLLSLFGYSSLKCSSIAVLVSLVHRKMFDVPFVFMLVSYSLSH
jgi:hypothetical protein